MLYPEGDVPNHSYLQEIVIQRKSGPGIKRATMRVVHKVLAHHLIFRITLYQFIVHEMDSQNYIKKVQYSRWAMRK